MTIRILEPGAVVGVLGGGQLGAMFASAARRMGYHVAVWDPDIDAPAHQIATHSFSTAFSDLSSREQFASIVQAATVEWENVPAELCRWLEERCPMRPSSTVLSTLQDRIAQKQFLSSRHLPVAPFAIVESGDQLAETIARLGCPVVCKTATSGYDGKGQWILRTPADAKQLETLMKQPGSSQRWIVERFIVFARELSVLVVRNESGEFRLYPVVENRHEQGILRATCVPASIDSGIAERAKVVSLQAVAALQGAGVFCVELFHTTDGDLLINEIAPRPHNSGHYTLDVCSVSQFEQQVRVTCDLPLGETRLLGPAVMVNLIGEEVRSVMSAEGCSNLHSTPGAVLHLYGKQMIRPGRKMGHVTFTGPQEELVAAAAQKFMVNLGTSA
ncbi:MAG: 5-(carboxyamino)imidazole ribonucleotide synthase [Nitrospira sp.]|nr:5-(carboxyamino)imidazole ribonucleotide synthase [Nitrospira sp.]